MNINNIILVNDIKEANAITHSGTFHADDIFSTIFLSKLKPIRLYRINELEKNHEIKDKIIFDIGCGKFDHHGENARIRENKIRYSSLGLLFEEYGKEYLKKCQVEDVELAYQMFLKEFILQIDAIDNGVFPNHPIDYKITSLSEMIEMFNQTWKESKKDNETFLEALAIASLIYNRIEKRILDKIAARKEVDAKIESSINQMIIFDTYLPFMDFLINSSNEKARNILFAILPSNRGGYNIRTINKTNSCHENRLDFPKEWGGKTSKELQEQTKVKTFRFCHPNLFLCSCDTLEDAIKIAQLAKKEVSTDTP